MFAISKRRSMASNKPIKPGMKSSIRLYYNLGSNTTNVITHSSSIKKTSIRLYTLVYFDDILIIGTYPQLVHDLISKLHHKFALKKLGKPNYFLGIEVHEQKGGFILLTQTKYTYTC